jgi:hypothetical protein
MKVANSVVVALAALGFSLMTVHGQYMYKFVFSGTSYQLDGTGNVVAVPITDQTLIADRAAQHGVNPSTLAIVFHLGGDSKGDTVEVVSANSGAVQDFEFGFWFGSDPSLGRSALTNSSLTEIRRVDQVFTLNNSTYTYGNTVGMGSAFITKRTVQDSNGNRHMTIEGPIQWTVNPQYPNSTKICIGTFTASQVLF